MFPEAPRIIPDGGISPVRLATMAFLWQPFPQPSRLKCSPTYTPYDVVCSQARCQPAVVHLAPALCPVVVSVVNRHDREPLCLIEALPR
jgi:hypothetical protein